jgi:hypothetical protein
MYLDFRRFCNSNLTAALSDEDELWLVGSQFGSQPASARFMTRSINIRRFHQFRHEPE